MSYEQNLNAAQIKGLQIKLKNAILRSEELSEDSTIDDYVDYVINKEANEALRRKYEMQEHNKLQEDIDAMTIAEIATALESQE